jgi:hypothetical protein
LRPKAWLLGSFALLVAMGLAAAPALGQEVVEAQAGENVVARAPTTPASDELGPLDAPAERQPIPDLVLEPPPMGGGPGFCTKFRGGTLSGAIVANQGFGDAPETTTEAEFDFFDGSETTREIRTPPIAGGGLFGERMLVEFDLPGRVLQGQGYTITVTADSRAEVAEVDELNNFAFEVCPPLGFP